MKRLGDLLPSLALLGLLSLSAPAGAAIRGLHAFLDRCPQNDPAFSVISSDFLVYVDNSRATLRPCTEPVSAMPQAQLDNVLVTYQTLRLIYYMDRGQHGHLPWTAGSLYDWMKSKIGGVNITTSATLRSECCSSLAGRIFINIQAQTPVGLQTSLGWPALEYRVELFAHETRHRDGYGHRPENCCGAGTGACDLSFVPASLSAYGVEWWLDKLLLDGTIDVDMQCLPVAEAQRAYFLLLGGANSQYRSRFCKEKPPLITAPAPPPGARCFPPLRH